MFAAACSKAGTRERSHAADTTAAAAPQPPGPMAIVTVLYNPPKDTAAFEKYYRETHVPLVVANQKEIGFTRADLTKFTSTADGKKPPFYRQAELYFNSMDDLKKGIATPGFKKVADDLKNFATGGLTGMIATATNTHESGSAEAPAAIVTVIYKTPKDTAAFEKYYAETHLPLVTASKDQIGFERAELTKFDANLDGSHQRATVRLSCISPRWTRSRRASPPRRSRRWRTIWANSPPAAWTHWSEWRRNRCRSPSSPREPAGIPESWSGRRLNGGTR